MTLAGGDKPTPAYRMPAGMLLAPHKHNAVKQETKKGMIFPRPLILTERSGENH